MPAAASLPAPFNEPATLDKYCRVSAWGYAEVVESCVAGLEVGALLFGYVPIGSAEEVVELRKGEGEGVWVEESEGRGHLNGVYNVYFERGVSGVDGEGEGEREGRGWDAVMEVLFGTAWLMNRFVFSWEEGITPVHPIGGGEWTAEDADLTGAVVVMLAASGKTGLCVASELRAGRPSEKQPFKVVAVGSDMSRGFTLGTKLFDEVLGYHDLDEEGFDLPVKLGGRERKVVLMDFGARGDAVDRWAKALEGNCKRLQVLVLGADPMATELSETAKRTQDPRSGVAQVFAGGIRDRAIDILGPSKYFAEQEAAWDKFKAGETILGLQLKRGEGLAEFSKGWDALIKGEHGPNAGLIYELNM
jgi:hypothetical protein